MSDVLFKDGTLTIEGDSPFEVKFSSATDIILPFRGTVVLPAAQTEQPDFDSLGMYDFMFLSFRYPKFKENGNSIFNVLRNLKDEPFEIDGNYLLLVVDDQTILSNIDIFNQFSDPVDTFPYFSIKKFYQTIFKENITVSNIPRYLLIKLDDSSIGVEGLPKDIRPFSRKKNFKLKDNLDSEIADLKTALANNLSGTIYAFDQSGRQTEARSALLRLGVDKPIVNAPASDNIVKVQFVDIYGRVLKNDSMPLSHLKLTPSLGGIAEFDTNQFYTLNFGTGDNRTIDFCLKEAPSTFGADDFDHFYHFHYLALWPGFGFKFKEVKNTSPATKINLIKDFKKDEETQPSFVRICIFHPEMTFQKKTGGRVEISSFNDFDGHPQKKSIFKESQLNYFSDNNKIKIFNTGDLFFADYYKTISGLTSDGSGTTKKQDELYQANWSGNAHMNLKGTISLRKISSENITNEIVFETLNHYKDNALFLKLPDKDDRALMLSLSNTSFTTSTEELEEGISSGCLLEVHTESSPGVFSKDTHKGFIRAGSLLASELEIIGNQVRPSRAIAYWKDISGQLQEVAFDDLVDPLSLPNTFDIQGDFVETLADNTIISPIELAIDNSDPPRLQINRIQTISEIQSNIGATVSNFFLLVLNVPNGSSHVISLQPPGSNATDTNVNLLDPSAYPLDSDEQKALIQLRDTYTAEDRLFVAFVNAEIPSTPLENWLMTKFHILQYPDVDHERSLVPFQNEELGGLLRSTIQKGVKVKALFWEQFLANLSNDEALARGHSTNEELTALINQNINGKRGFAFMDRSTRAFGSWHQKATALIKHKKSEVLVGPDPGKTVIGYLGGMDLTKGRWDTPDHYSSDPDRQGNPWYDVHLKIEGNGAIDLLQNFKHRWKSLEAFFDLGDPTASCLPVTTSPALEDDVRDFFEMPDPVDEKIGSAKIGSFVQINRTFPPFSCFANPGVLAVTDVDVPDGGELGSLHSYKKGIADAEKFIFINDQYFFSPEMAYDLHQRLIEDNGPEFLVLILPKDLSEDDYIDPLLFKWRARNIQLLYFGGTIIGTDDQPMSHRIMPNTQATATNDIRNKVAILSPVNRNGDAVYVHSKHMIVDDVWMTIGSANMNNRSLTYDMEINAAIVDGSLFKGGTTLVRNHRIKICQQLLGVPPAYTTILQDPYACFRLLKAIEQQKDDYSLKLHPLEPTVKWMDVDYFKRVDETAFDNEVDFVANMPMDSSSFRYLILNVLDPDGRERHPERLGYLVGLAGLGKNMPLATTTLGFNFSNALKTAIDSEITSGNEVHLIIEVTIDSDSTTSYQIGRYKLLIAAATNNVTLESVPTGEVSVPISIIDTVTIDCKVVSSDTTVAQLGNGTLMIDPTGMVPPITYGSERNDIVSIG